MASIVDAGCAATLEMCAPSAARQVVTSPISVECTASVLPSGANVAASSAPSGDAICATSRQGMVAIKRTVPAPVRAAMCRPSGAMAIPCQSASGPSVWQRT